jgi:hypothetical protein
VHRLAGNRAFGAGNIRQEFADAERRLVAKAADHGYKDQLHKNQFHIDLKTITLGLTLIASKPGKYERKPGASLLNSFGLGRFINA